METGFPTIMTKTLLTVQWKHSQITIVLSWKFRNISFTLQKTWKHRWCWIQQRTVRGQTAFRVEWAPHVITAKSKTNCEVFLSVFGMQCFAKPSITA